VIFSHILLNLDNVRGNQTRGEGTMLDVGSKAGDVSYIVRLTSASRMTCLAVRVQRNVLKSGHMILE
jgi:hypothetical protein